MLSTLLPVLVYTYHGVESVPKILIWSASAMGTGPREMVWRVQLPAALPAILIGMRVALGFSFVIAIAAEMIAAATGSESLSLSTERAALMNRCSPPWSPWSPSLRLADISFLQLSKLRVALERQSFCEPMRQAHAYIDRGQKYLVALSAGSCRGGLGTAGPLGYGSSDFLPRSRTWLRSLFCNCVGEFTEAIAASLYRAGVGFIIAMVVGIAVGFAMARSKAGQFSG